MNTNLRFVIFLVLVRSYYQKLVSSIRLLQVITCITLIITGIAPTHGDEGNLSPGTLSRRIDQLERDFIAMRPFLHRDRVPETFKREGGFQLIIDIERVVADITGHIEEIQFELGRLHSHLDKVESRLDVLQRSLEYVPPRETGGAWKNSIQEKEKKTLENRDCPTEASEKTPSVLSPSFATPRRLPPSNNHSNNNEESAMERYEAIATLFSQGNYAVAERALLAFEDAYPQDLLASHALYWLGEMYYVQGNFGRATVKFAEGYQRYAESSKLPTNLLKLGSALAGLGQVESACATFNRLSIDFPDEYRDLEQHAAPCQAAR